MSSAAVAVARVCARAQRERERELRCTRTSLMATSVAWLSTPTASLQRFPMRCVVTGSRGGRSWSDGSRRARNERGGTSASAAHFDGDIGWLAHESHCSSVLGSGSADDYG
jgi:hypothetical protein